MHPIKNTPIHILALPVELHHQIIFLLDVQDVFALRRTCTFFFNLTRGRGLWSMFFTRLRATQALPYSRAEFTAMSLCKAERALLAASKVEASFLQLREHLVRHGPDVKQPSLGAYSWRVLNFISDRFILSVDNTAVMIWDTVALASSSSAATSSPWAHFTLSNFLGYAVCQSTLYFAISRFHSDAAEHQSVVIYSVALPPSEALEISCAQLQREGKFRLDITETFEHMDPSSGRALAFESPGSIHIVHWRDGNKRSMIALQPNELEQGWNGVKSLRFCGPYILCFRAYSVEAYPAPSETLPPLRHRLGPVCLHDLSLSRVRVSSDGDLYTIFMLTGHHDKGVYHYRIRVFTAPVPGMAIDVLAKGSIQSPDPLPGMDARCSFDDIVRQMFVITWSVGSAGLRGVWVDRQRGNVDPRVVAFTTHPSRLRSDATTAVPVQDGAWDRDAENRAPGMEGKVVHVVSPNDLRDDDITICAVSEWTGCIALGSCFNGISLLRCQWEYGTL